MISAGCSEKRTKKKTLLLKKIRERKTEIMVLKEKTYNKKKEQIIKNMKLVRNVLTQERRS
jgi:hypothetical protein